MKCSGRGFSGFTLIELMITLAILGLLVMMVLPSFGRWMANVKVRTEAESLQNGLRLAQLEAAKRNASVTMTLTSDSSPNCSSTASDTGINWVICAGGNIIQTYIGNPNAGAAVTSDFGTISFDGLGRTNLGEAGAIDVNSSAGACETSSASGIRCLRILVSTGGKVRMCDPLLSAGDPAACS